MAHIIHKHVTNPIENPIVDEEEISTNHSLDMKVILLAAIAYVIALTWSNTISSEMNKIFPIDSNTSTSKRIMFSMLITLIVLAIGIAIVWMFKKERKARKDLGI